MTHLSRRQLFRRAAKLAPALILPELILPKRKVFAVGWSAKPDPLAIVAVRYPGHPWDFVDGRYVRASGCWRLGDDYWRIPYYDTQKNETIWGTVTDDGIKFWRYPSPWQGDGGEYNWVDASDISNPQESTPR